MGTAKFVPWAEEHGAGRASRSQWWLLGRTRCSAQCLLFYYFFFDLVNGTFMI